MSLTEQIHGMDSLQQPERKPLGLWARFNAIEITAKKVKRKTLMHFSRQLAVFIRAGVPIIDALSILTDEESDKFFRAILDDVIESLRSGRTFADSIGAHGDAFPSYYVGILRSAELTGQLDTVLVQVADYIERDIEARQKVTSALTYPAVIAVMAVGVVITLVVYVLPKFTAFFRDLNAKLPLSTRFLIGASHDLRAYWFIPAGLALVAVLVLYWLTQNERGRLARDRVLLKLPVVGDLVRHAVIERFCRILSSMVSSGVPMPEALATVAEATSNRVYRAALLDAREAMLRGEGLAGPIAATGLFPSAARQMLRVGENTGSMDEQLAIASEFYGSELDHKIKRFTALFEPAVIVGMGAIVAFVAISLVQAMYGIYHQVHV
jgi:type IV pilus assembly protein PilC